MTHRVRPADLLVFALLVLAWAAAPANAKTDSSGAQYEDAPPTACGEPTCKGENLSAPPGSNSARPESKNNAANDDSGAAENDSEAAGSPGPGPQGEKKGDGGQKPANQGPAGEQGKSTASTDTSQEGDDGTSPLVPILVVIAILAAISAGVVIYRRRQLPSDDTPSATPPK